MRVEKGITLVTLIIYVLLITFVIAGISSITASFYSNVSEFDKNSESAVTFAKFNMHFLADIKRSKAQIDSLGDNYVILSYVEKTENSNNLNFEMDHEVRKQIEYSVQNSAIYRNKVKICDNIKDVLFTVDNANNTVKIEITIGEYKKTTTYKLENAKDEAAKQIEVDSHSIVYSDTSVTKPIEMESKESNLINSNSVY